MFEYLTRVYYEDTDAGGIIYHANYLKYMERARCEWLASVGYDVQTLLSDQLVNFVVSQAIVNYHKPGQLFDQLTVTCKLLQLRKVQMTLEQNIYNKNELLCSGQIKLATLHATSFKLIAIPDALRNAIVQ